MRANSRSATPICAEAAGTIGARLREHGEQRVLAQIGGFARHVRAGHDQEARRAFARAVELAIVADEGAALARQRLLHRGMPAAFDEEAAAIVDMRAHIVLRLRKLGQRRRAVQRGERGGGVRNRFLGGEHRTRKLFEQRKLARQRFARGVQDAAFERGKLVRGEAHGVGERLLVPEGRRMRLGLQRGGGAGAHLDEIAEHLIVLDFQRLDAGLRRVGRLQLREHHLGIGRELAQFVERRVVAASDEAAIAREIGKVIAKRRAQPFRKRSAIRKLAGHLLCRVEDPLTPALSREGRGTPGVPR